jgi:hypothetical protein
LTPDSHLQTLKQTKIESSYVHDFLGLCAWERENWIIVIKAFFDESWNPNKPRMFAVVGVLAPAEEWEQIEAGWQAALAERNVDLANQGRKPISRYHASEMNARDHEFEGWTNEENAQFDQRMLSVIRGRDIFIISFAVVLDDMAMLVSKSDGVLARQNRLNLALSLADTADDFVLCFDGLGGGELMLRLDKVIKPWKEAAALNDHINLYGFWNETAFLTKSGDVGIVLRVTSS